MAPYAWRILETGSAHTSIAQSAGCWSSNAPALTIEIPRLALLSLRSVPAAGAECLDPLMIAAPGIGLDIPLKVLVWAPGGRAYRRRSIRVRTPCGLAGSRSTSVATALAQRRASRRGEPGLFAASHHSAHWYLNWSSTGKTAEM